MTYKICPLSMIQNPVPRSCYKEQCMIWDLKNKTCGFVTGLRRVTDAKRTI